MWLVIDSINRTILGSAISFTDAIRAMALARRCGIKADVIKALVY